MNYVNVKIDLKKPAGNLSFGYPCILSIGGVKSYTECMSIEDVVTAGYASETDTYKAAALMLSQANAPSKIAVCGVASASDLTALDGKDWRQLILVGTVEDYTPFITYVTTHEYKQLFVTVSDVTGLEDLGDSDKVNGYVHSNPLFCAALVGETAGREVGSFTYAFKKLVGIDPMNLGDTQIKAIHDANANTYITVAGDNVTSEGKAMSGEYIDVVDSMDYIISQIAYKSQKVLHNNPKLPFDNKGISMLESACKDVLRTAHLNGMIATKDDGTPDYDVYYAPRSAVSASDRAERRYTGGTFRFGLAGAVHYADVRGTVEI